MSQKIVYSDEEDIKPKKQRKPLSDEQKTALRERLEKARQAKKNKRECRMTSLSEKEQLKVLPPEPVVEEEEEVVSEPVVKEPLTKPAKRSYKKKDVKNDEVVEKVEKKMEEHIKVLEPVVNEEKPKRKYIRKPKITIPNPF